MADLEAIGTDGFNARIAEKDFWSNPFYENRPSETGEPVDEWNAKAESWADGWRKADKTAKPFPADRAWMNDL